MIKYREILENCFPIMTSISVDLNCDFSSIQNNHYRITIFRAFYNLFTYLTKLKIIIFYVYE